MKVAFIGHKRLEDKVNIRILEKKIKKEVEILIKQYGADEFIFGSMVGFDHLCYLVVTQLKKKYPHIKRTFVSQFPLPDQGVLDYKRKFFEKCEYPLPEREMGSMSIIKRNEKIIDECDFLITFYDKIHKSKFKYYEEVIFTHKENNTTPMGTTKIALNYAFRNDKDFINVFEYKQA